MVSFHGSLVTATPARAEAVKAAVLVFIGADDPFVKSEQIDTFKQEMQDAGVDYRFVNLPGAKHSFTNPAADSFGERFNLPLEYNAHADQRSWRETRAFFDRIFTQ